MGIFQIYAPINVKGGDFDIFISNNSNSPPLGKIIGQNVHPAASEGGKMSFVRSKSLACGRHIRSKSPYHRDRPHDETPVVSPTHYFYDFGTDSLPSAENPGIIFCLRKTTTNSVFREDK